MNTKTYKIVGAGELVVVNGDVMTAKGIFADPTGYKAKHQQEALRCFLDAQVVSEDSPQIVDKFHSWLEIEVNILRDSGFIKQGGRVVAAPFKACGRGLRKGTFATGRGLRDGTYATGRGVKHATTKATSLFKRCLPKKKEVLDSDVVDATPQGA